MRISFFIAALVVAFSSCNTQHHTLQTDLVALDTIEVVAKRYTPYQAEATRESDLVHTKLEVSFDYEKQQLNGKATITLKPHFYPQSQLVLDAKHFDIQTVALVKSDNSLLALQYTYDTSQLHIDLDRTYLRGEKYNIFIAYTAKPNESASGGSAAITDDKGLYFINPLGKDSLKPIQIWTQGETESNSHWFPTIDKPNQKTTNEIYITRPTKYVSLSNGTLINTKENGNGTATDYWKMDLPHAPYLIMMAVGDFAIIKDRWRDVPVNYYVEKDYAPYAKEIFGNTPEMMEFFSQKLGFDYPWPQYAQVVVRDYVSGAMENTSATLHGEFIQRNTRERLDETYEDVISHELFHQWFGDLITCESWSNIPLNESFATYGEYLWNEYKYGRTLADYKQYENYRKYLEEAAGKNVDLVRFYYDNREDMFDRHSYEKGGLLLHYLRNIIGDDAFFKSLELYLRTYQFKKAEIHQLRIAFEETTGKDLNWFFNQWFLNSGHPVLDVKYSFANDTVSVYIKQTHNTDSKLVYTLPMSVAVYFADTTILHRIDITKAEETFSFVHKNQPLLVDADPERVVLCVRNETKSVNEWIYQLEHSSSFVARHDALEKLIGLQKENPAAASAVHRTAKSDFYVLRQDAIDEMMFGPKDDSLCAVLKDITANDRFSSVRKSALEKLGDWDKQKDLLPIYSNAIKDSSYSVAAAALKALSNADGKRGLEAAKQFEGETNHEMLAAVADVYAKEGHVDYEAFFKSKIKNSTAFNRYSLLYYYANFLTRMDKKTVLSGIAEIEPYAMDTSSHFTSGAAKGALKRIQKSFEEKRKAAQSDLANAQGQTEKIEIQERISQYDEIVGTVSDVLEKLKKK